MARKLRRVSGRIRKALDMSVRQQRRETIYKMLQKRFGIVPCFVCNKHVKHEHATLEHIIPVSKGGTDDMKNLSISHNACNKMRSNNMDETEDHIHSHTLG